MTASSPRSRELAIAAACGAAVSLVSVGKAFHLDEAFFLAVARQILRDPSRPLDFLYNWTGWTLPAEGVYVHSVLTPYALAAGLTLTGWSEVFLRLVFVPFDAVSAAALCAIARRFLKRPLRPVLIVLVSPYWLLPVPLLIAERWVILLTLSGLWSLMSGLESRRPWKSFLALVLFSLAVVVKTSAAFVLLPALWLLWKAKRPAGELAAFLLAPLAAAFADARWLEPGRWSATRAILDAGPSWPERAHHLRAFLAFTGGLGLTGLVWPLLCARDRSWRRFALAVPAAALFLPFADLPFLVPGLADRLTGALFAAGAGLTAFMLAERRSRVLPGWGFLCAWFAGGAVMALANWSLSARAALLYLPALTLALAARLEDELPLPALERLYAASVAVVLAASLCLAWADARYAGAQRQLAQAVKSAYLDAGTPVRFTGHWGLQHYLEEAGAVSLDEGAGGWAAVKPGTAVVVPAANALIHPPRGVRCAVSTITVDGALPVRLIRTRAGQAGFYSDAWGFLPYAFSREPVDEFTVCKVL